MRIVRRSPLPERHFNYARVGATRSTDDTDGRPRRERITEESVRIGSGQARWEHACTQVLSWDIQRHAGYSVLPIDQAPVANSGPGQKHHPRAAFPQMQPGLTVQLRRRFGPLPMTMPIRIVYVLDEPHRKGFAYGTLAGHPVSGEVAYIVERHADDSVHFILRSFSGPGKGLWALTYPIVLLLRGGFRDSYLQALKGPSTDPSE